MGKYDGLLQYIGEYWDSVTHYVPEDNGVHIGLPYAYVSPNTTLFDKDMFYWDAYPIILGLVLVGKVDLAKNMVNNFCALFERFGIVPMRNKYYNVGISQPPFLTSMIRAVYEKDKDDEWLEYAMSIAQRELEENWMDKDKHMQKHMVYEGLSRYCDHFITDATSEHESGWDMTSRFGGRCLSFLPIDLNSCLYKYEKDLAWYYDLIENNEEASKFTTQAKTREEKIRELCFDGFFYDYDYNKEERSSFLSTAGFYPLWSGLATKEEAASAIGFLRHLLFPGGVANTSLIAEQEIRQWDYPNGWPNQQWIIILGLLQYGFEDEAKDIAQRFLDCVHDVFSQTGKVWEKYDVVERTIGKNGRYPTQEGFSWTNAVTVLCYELVKE